MGLPQPPPPPPEYVPVHYNGQLPAATGNVAKELDKVPIATQRNTAEELFVFLADPNSDLKALNGEARCFTAMVAVPNSTAVRLIYGLGMGTSGIGQVSPVANKLLALFGEGSANSQPQVIMFEPTLRLPENTLNPTEGDTDAALRNNHALHSCTHTARNVNTFTEIIRIVPTQHT